MSLYYPQSRNSYESLMNYYAVTQSSISQKADTPYKLSTAGYHQTVYGRGWAPLFEMEWNNFGVLIKYDWTDSGIRVLTDESVVAAKANNNNNLGGVVEGGTVPDSDVPTVAEIEILPKTVDRKVTMSDNAVLLARRGSDDIAATLEYARNWHANEMLKAIGKMISADVESVTKSADYAGTESFETWDRIISSNAVAAALDTNNRKFYNCYGDGFDRTGTNKTLFDSRVFTASGSGTIGGADGRISPELMDRLIFQTGGSSGQFPDVLVCTWEVLSDINTMYRNLSRTAGENVSPYTESRVEFGTNGVVPARAGTKAGFQTQSINGIPIVGTARKTSGNASESGRVFALTTRYDSGNGRPMMGFARLLPLTYSETDVTQAGSNLSTTGAHVSIGVFTMKGEVICTKPDAQGMIRDISIPT